jgi:hypothetical protein
MSVSDDQVIAASAATLECRDHLEAARFGKKLWGGSNDDHTRIIFR